MTRTPPPAAVLLTLLTGFVLARTQADGIGPSAAGLTHARSESVQQTRGGSALLCRH